ncbi:MAG: hypothetical protein R3D99_00775 [Altererythrobacter sp.]
MSCKSALTSGIAAMAALAVPVLAAPAALAQAGPDLALAQQAYETGKTSGITRKPRGEADVRGLLGRDAFHAWQELLPEASWQQLGPDFRADPMRIRSIGFALDAGEGDLRSEKFKSAADVALDRFAGFVEGDAGKTRMLFENLGVCHKRQG